MNTLQRMGVLAVFLAAVIVCVLQHRTWTMLLKEKESLRRQMDQQKAQANAGGVAVEANALTPEQLSELRALRSEVTRLREETKEIEALKEANQKLVASLKDRKASGPHKEIHPEDALPQDIHPRDSWAFRGYATPEGTIESFFWAKANGNRAVILEAVSPEMQPEVQKQWTQWESEGRDFVQEMNKSKAEEFRIADRRQLSDDEIVVTLYTSRPADDGHIFFNEFGPAVLQRIGGQWKLTDKHPSDESR
jgi:hypothetical protein